MLDPECLEVIQRFNEAMYERVDAENALAGHGIFTDKARRFEEAVHAWSEATDALIKHRKTCKECPRSVRLKVEPPDD